MRTGCFRPTSRRARSRGGFTREVRDLPIVSPHGHTDPRWYRRGCAVPDPARLFVTPDHYIFRMLYSQGVTLEEMGIPRKDGGAVETDARKIWRTFAERYYLFRGTPTRLWLDQAFAELFGMTVRLSADTADHYFDRISECLARPEFRPRALFERFKIEVIATTESPLDPLDHHKKIAESGWKGRVVTAYRPDPVVDPEFDGFKTNIETFGNLTRCDTFSWHGYLEAHRLRRAYFKQHGATSTDHGHVVGADGRSAAGRRRAAVRQDHHGRIQRGRCGTVPRADADRNGAHEPRRRAGDADPSGLDAQPQSAALRQVRPRHGRGYS